MDSSFTKVALKVPKMSGFDKSHQNLLTSKCGTITPILIDELIPGSKISLKLALNAQLPPLASDTFMRCSIKTEAFFVPFRLLAGSFESWFCDTPQQFVDATGSLTFTEQLGWLPTFGFFDASESATLIDKFCNPGTLGDYLGLRFSTTTGATFTGNLTAMPFLAYWRCIDDWYRNTLVQRPVFCRPTAFVYANGQSTTTTTNSSPSGIRLYAGTAPYYFYTENVRASSSGSLSQNYCFTNASSLSLANGKYLYDLAQRNFGLDYFTTAMPDKQLGNQHSVSFSTSSSTGSFTIQALREANALQQFSERNQLSGVRYQDTLYQRYGSNLSSGVAQRALFLGANEYVVYSKGIYQQGQDITSGSVDGSTSVNTNNPFSASTGAKYGSASATGEGLHIKFEANEPGYLLVMATLVPKVTYSSGINRRFFHYNRAGSLTDMANPILQSVGPQPIYRAELVGYVPLSANYGVFGYTDRYAEFKTMEDELHGILRDGGSLDAFALQRSFAFGSAPQINSSFLEIPTDYMDQVTAVTGDISEYGYWLDTYFDYKVAMPISKYSLPTLQDPAYEHGRTVVVDKGGSRL